MLFFNQQGSGIFTMKTKRYVVVGETNIPLTEFVKSQNLALANAQKVLNNIGHKMRVSKNNLLPVSDVTEIINKVTKKQERTTSVRKKKNQSKPVFKLSELRNLRVKHQHFDFEGKVISIGDTTFEVEWPNNVGKLSYKWQDADSFSIIR